MKKNSYLTVTDQFCGAGGSSQGVRKVSNKDKFKGMEVKLALNHWKLAIETHNTNFPDTDHDCTDISACDPRRYPSTDMLITSPECTNHSLAKGKARKVRTHIDPAEERSRATMWDVPRFAEYHQYNIVIVENVVDARYWVQFDAWLMAMHSLGYLHECVFFNSQHFHPTPQSRDRMYVVFWKRGNKKPNLVLTPLAFCHHCSRDVHSIQRWKMSEAQWQKSLKKRFPGRVFMDTTQWGKYRTQYNYHCPVCSAIVEPYYYAAFNCIDWSDIGTRISERKKPLSPNTMARIQYGIDKFWDQPQIITTKYTSGVGSRVRATAQDVLPTQPGEASHAILTPLVMSSEWDVKKQRVTEVDNVMWTQTGEQSSALLRPPFFIKNYGGNEKAAQKITESPFHTHTGTDHHGIAVMPHIIEMWRTGKARGTDKPLSTVVAGGNHHALVNYPPLMVENYGQSKSKPATKAIGGLTTTMKHGILTDDSIKSFLTYYNGGSKVAGGINYPLFTQPTGERANVVISTGKKPDIQDCFYRMLYPPEVKIGMAFDRDYIILGTGKDQVKQCGNAVTPPVMEWLVEQCAATLI